MMITDLWILIGTIKSPLYNATTGVSEHENFSQQKTIFGYISIVALKSQHLNICETLSIYLSLSLPKASL